MAAFLRAVYEEATRRGYEFDRSKIAKHSAAIELSETEGQLLYEWKHLRRKLKARAPHESLNESRHRYRARFVARVAY